MRKKFFGFCLLLFMSFNVFAKQYIVRPFKVKGSSADVSISLTNWLQSLIDEGYHIDMIIPVEDEVVVSYVIIYSDNE